MYLAFSSKKENLDLLTPRKGHLRKDFFLAVEFARDNIYVKNVEISFLIKRNAVPHQIARTAETVSLLHITGMKPGLHVGPYQMALRINRRTNDSDL